MTNVFIPTHLLTDVKVKETTEGEWIKGEYIEGTTTERCIYASFSA